ncbi:MFS transporter [Haloarcula sp. S1CR25-12]|uniref:MFS transporter n=1 Tax=Haloarcula saliterrae TaxID=2950534 RepID=A0ABU2FFT8_9EURY|nr:MFS transporter [Haloarcula sp. S1CR25-12]MDS0261137.1 MFS transporter [Haloarcula sp. S1CR25-12]
METTQDTASLVGILTAASLAGGASKYAIGPLVPEITASFDVTTATVGIALSAMWFAFAAVQFIGGVLADLVGERFVLLASVSLIFLGSSLLFVAPTFPIFLGALVVLGSGTGALLISSATYIGKTFETMGGKLGVITLGSSAAGLLAPLLAVTLGALYGWRIVMLSGATLALPIFVGIYVEVDSVPRVSSDDRRSDIRAGLEQVLAGRVLLLTLFGASMYFVFQAIASFFPTMLLGTTDVSPRTAAVALSAFFALTAVSNPVFGRLSERLGRTPVLSACLGVSIIGFALLFVSTTPLLVSVGVAFVGVGSGWGSTLTSKLMELFTRGERGTGYGVMNTLANVLGSSGSAVTGVFALRYGWHQTIGLIAAILVCALSLLLVDSILPKNGGVDPSE